MKTFEVAALALVSLSMAVGSGCASPVSDTSDGAASAIGTAADITTLANGTIVFYHGDFGSASTVTAKYSPQWVDVGVTRHVGAPGADVTEVGFLLGSSDGAYTLTAKNNPDPVGQGLDDLPKNIIHGAVGRLVLFSVASSGASTVLRALETPENLIAFEKITIDGDTASYDTTTTTGRHATGKIALAGLAGGTGNYAIMVMPRELPNGGSLLGTHPFELVVACDAGGTACVKHSPFDTTPDTSAIENGPEVQLRDPNSCYSDTTESGADDLACVLSKTDGVWEQCHGGHWYRGGDDTTGPYGACTTPAQ